MKTKNKNIAILLIVLVTGIFLGWMLFGTSGATREAAHEHTGSEDVEWTCSMHPDVRSPEKADCPICGMELIPVSSDGAGGGEVFQMTADAMKLANIQTMKVGTEPATKELRLNGKVVADERNTYSQSTHIPGRIEDLRINVTGERVSRGQVLAVVYSPEMVTAQEELLLAYKIREQQPALYAAVREKLRNWRIGDALIERILSSGKALQSFPVTADVGGIVTERLVNLGDYVERGMPLYQVTDLSKIWVLFDLYESQLSWVKEGSRINFSIASLPGETFEGEITFIDPILNDQSRVATARVEMDNSDGRLKPEMFASGTLSSGMGPGRTEEISVPRSAILWTGKRSLVYIKESLGDKVGFQLREVVLGPSLGDSYVIEEGLLEGEEIVVNGTFTVDAAVQLSGKASMMNPDRNSSDISDLPSKETRVEVSPRFQEQWDSLLNAYLKIKESLVQAEEANFPLYVEEFQGALQQINSQDLQEGSRSKWNERKKALEKAGSGMLSVESLEDRRQRFLVISEEMIKTISDFGSKNRTIFVNYCPMANSDQGAYWLSEMREIRNPYFGDAMLSCGEIVEEIN